MLLLIDNFLNSITMYRLVLYYLLALIFIAVVFSFFGLLSFSPLAIIASMVFLTSVCYVTNKVFAFVFEAPTNVESVYITALILTLIIPPLTRIPDVAFLGWVAVLATASKYILAIYRKHVFNPVAVAVIITAFALNQSAIWWVGTAIMMPFVLLGGFLVVRKIRRADLVFSFLITAILVITAFTFARGGDVFLNLEKTIFSSPILFFACVMLTEPLTTPPTRKLQIFYGIFVGFLFAPQMHLGPIYSTPELSLFLGNIASYLVSPKQKFLLRLKEKIQIAPGMIDFLFVPDKKMIYKPGQYLEWTLQHPNTDSRGSRRYLTIASSPTEETLRIGVRFYEQSSSYKKSLAQIDEKIPIVASQLSGDFVLKDNPLQKYVFIAGGIGITPFRSIIKFLVDTKQKRDIVLFYSNKDVSEIVYKDVFDQASLQLGIKTIYTLTDLEHIPPDWIGKRGRLDANMILGEVPDFQERLFYLSGPHAMVKGYESLLHQMGVKNNQIIVDYFPGFA